MARPCSLILPISSLTRINGRSYRAFAASLRRRQALANGVGDPAVGPDAVTFRRPVDGSAGAKAPARIGARAQAMLAIDRIGMPPSMLAALKHLASLHNPEFYQKEKLRFSTWNTPRFIRCYRETIGQLLLPRGLSEKAARVVTEGGSELVVADCRDDDATIEVSLTANLTPEQSGGGRRWPDIPSGCWSRRPDQARR